MVICSPQTKQMALPLTSVNEYLAVYVFVKNSACGINLSFCACQLKPVGARKHTSHERQFHCFHSETADA